MRVVSVSVVPDVGSIWYQYDQQTEEKQVRATAKAYTQLKEVLQNEEAGGAARGIHFHTGDLEQEHQRMEYYKRSSISSSQRLSESVSTANGGK